MRLSCVANEGVGDLTWIAPAIKCRDNAATLTIGYNEPDPAIDPNRWLVYDAVKDMALDTTICSALAVAIVGDYGIGSIYGGVIGGCRDEGWLLYHVEVGNVIGRVDMASGKFADAVAWFRKNRPVGGRAGELFSAAAGESLPALKFTALWNLAKSVPYQTLRRSTEKYQGHLVRYRGRVAFEVDAFSYVDVTKVSGSYWKDTVVTITDAVEGDVIDFVGWVNGTHDYLTGAVPYINLIDQRLRN